jgi:hypothetical protein
LIVPLDHCFRHGAALRLGIGDGVNDALANNGMNASLWRKFKCCLHVPPQVFFTVARVLVSEVLKNDFMKIILQLKL